MNTKSAAACLALVVLVFLVLIAPSFALAANASDTVLINLTDNFSKPLVNAEVQLMREGAFEPLARSVTDSWGTASFQLADTSGRFYILATLDFRRVPYERFFNSANYAKYTYLSPIIRFADGKIAAKLKLDWNNYLLLRLAENRNFNFFFLRTEESPHYLVRVDDGIDVTHDYLFLPMNRMYKIWRATDANRPNEYLLWWDFYALPGETVNAY